MLQLGKIFKKINRGNFFKKFYVSILKNDIINSTKKWEEEKTMKITKKVNQKIKEQVKHYTYRVTWSDKDQEYVGLCAEFPSLSWLDRKSEKALAGVYNLVEKTVLDLLKNKEPVPQPLSQTSFSGKLVVRIPPDLHQALALRAKELGISLNRLINARLSHPG